MQPEQVLRDLGLKYEAKVMVTGSRRWVLDYLVRYLYPIAIEVLREGEEPQAWFYYKLFKLLDLRDHIGAKPIIVCEDMRVTYEDLALASKYNVYVVFDDGGLRKAIEGADVEKVNLQHSEKLFKRANSEEAEACRKAIIEKLSLGVLSKEELIKQLSTSFHRKTIETQIKVLVKKKVIKAIARKADGKALYGLPHEGICVHDVSKRSRRKMLRQAILDVLKSSRKPLNIHMLASMVGVGKHLYYIAPVLHKLKQEGVIEKVEDGWVLKT